MTTGARVPILTRAMKQFFSYWLWPNPAGWHYSDSKVQLVLAICAAFVVLSFAISFWRRSVQNPITRKLSSGWSRAAFWFGIVGLVMAISRVETIQFLEMRLLWVLWFLSLIAYIVFQFVQFRRRHYTVLGRVQVSDDRDKYLPRKK